MRNKSFKYGYFCQSCRKELELDDQVYFVEENTGNYFCSEECIQDFYGPMARYYYQEHLKIRDPHDVSADDFEQYEKYASICVENPTEVWVDDGDSGEKYYYFFSEFSDEGGEFTYIVMTFCLEEEPTFVLMAFPTRDVNLVQVYRRGKREELDQVEFEMRTPVEQGLNPDILSSGADERGIVIKEEMLRNRRKSDIKQNEFKEHSYLLDETIENPDEAWEVDSDGDDMLLTLITQHDNSLHYVVICALDSGDEAHMTWRVLYHFPTDDPALVQRYRRGLPREGSAPSLNVVH